ncbi:MAG TPA: hypothetical protein VHT24_16725 [Pseudacidobacterium sp.]|jgi:hypothetical protein|nr:hypothetical protein [Pseudacidobacterium sp.]
MTDKEMALALGQYINSLLQKISGLEGIFAEYRITDHEGHRIEIPWREDLKRISQEPSFRQLSDAQSDAPLLAISDETEASALIRALCRNYFVSIPIQSK